VTLPIEPALDAPGPLLPGEGDESVVFARCELARQLRIPQAIDRHARQECLLPRGRASRVHPSVLLRRECGEDLVLQDLRRYLIGAALRQAEQERHQFRAEQRQRCWETRVECGEDAGGVGEPEHHVLAQISVVVEQEIVVGEHNVGEHRTRASRQLPQRLRPARDPLPEPSGQHPRRVRHLVHRVVPRLTVDVPGHLAGDDVAPPRLLLAHEHGVPADHHQIEIDGPHTAGHVPAGDHVPALGKALGEPARCLLLPRTVPLAEDMQPRH
jgi:hypothetical protein